MRRRTVVILLALVVILAGVLIGGRAWVRSRDYLEHGSTGRFPADARLRGDIASVPYRDGAQILYGLTLRNDGPLSVKVTAVERPAGRLSLFRVTGVRTGRPEQAGTDAPLPFRPFTLGRGKERYVEVVGRLGGCEDWEPNTNELIGAETVRFDVLGQSLTETVPLGTQVEIRRGARC